MYVTRLSWNSKGWQSPSGRNNKCRGNDSSLLYECKAGFGWEEWLFKKEHQLVIPPDNQEFQYGFLQCFNHSIPLEEVIYENVYLTSRKCIGSCNPANQGNYYAVAKIKTLIRLNTTQSHTVNTYFEQNGLITNMGNECTGIEGINMDKFNEGPGNPDNPRVYINVKFRTTDVLILEKQIPSIPKRFQMVELKPERKTHREFLSLVSQ